ncbi:MAG: hypothetical protein KIT72_12115 [Polyangiaceae bacterium]|nr:hypothetical protein [Polyangiaceae bacterium]MCW5791159.1 hypothetical protein [Polyangiaceae bacterium]
MKHAHISTLCECQARLSAELDEHRQVTRGWARHLRDRLSAAQPLHEAQVVAPAHSIHASQPRFQVAWLCPFCGRNTLRSFDASGLAWRIAPAATEAPASEAPGG